jgi:1-acyl-sn-glycerol-3-phosphate acyltransferase
MGIVTFGLLIPAALALIVGPASLPMRTAIAQLWSIAMLAILGGRVEVHGRPPSAPFLLAANHLGYVDILVLMSITPCLFVAKSEISSWPIVRWLARMTDTIFIDRARRADLLAVNAAVTDRLDRGLGIVIFPEATSTDGSGVLPFRSGLLAPAMGRPEGVHHATLSYTTPAGEAPARLAICWWGDMTMVPHVLDLAGLRGFTGRVTFGSQALRDDDRRRLANRLHDAVVADLPPVDTASLSPEPA